MLLWLAAVRSEEIENAAHMAGLSQNPILDPVVQPILGTKSMLTLLLLVFFLFLFLFQGFDSKLFISAVIKGHFEIASVPDGNLGWLFDCDKPDQSCMLNICL